MLDLKCLGKLAKLHPACARLLEGVIGTVLLSALIEAVYYILSSYVEGIEFSWRGMIVAALLPVYMALGKYRRGKTN